VSGALDGFDRMPDVRLVRELFPFCFALDAEMRLAMTGTRWESFDASVEVGAAFHDVFAIERPTGVRSEEEIAARADGIFLLALRSRPEFRLRGQFLPRGKCACAGSLLFVGGPWVTRLADLSALGLSVGDFPPHDPRGDFLVLLQTQESTNADLRQLAAQLRSTGAALEARTAEIEREMRLRASLSEQLRQSQKMEAIGRLAGGVAHDFNNILMAVQGYIALALSRVQPNDPVRAWLEEVRKASDRAANLTRQLLAFSRQQVLRPQVLDLVRELHEFEKLLGPMLGEQIRLTVRAEPGVGFVFADASAVNQIVMNLALNARDAMPRGGDLEIVLRARPDAASETLRSDGVVELSVRDTGVGMDEPTRSRMFEPFFTTKEPGKGSGLGLAQVDGLVEQCGGTIEVESKLGHGTVFRVLLPRVRAEQPAAEPAMKPAVGGRGEGLLLVGDEPLVRKLLEQLLSRAGYQVTSSGDPMHALSLAEGAARFDAIVTDVVMAGMTGPELVERIEASFGPVPTVFMSGHTEDEFIRRGEIVSHRRFIPKPFAPQDLLQRLREVVERGESDSSVKI